MYQCWYRKRFGTLDLRLLFLANRPYFAACASRSPFRKIGCEIAISLKWILGRRTDLALLIRI